MGVNMTEIKRYKVGYLGLEEAKNGQYVAHGDYLEEVRELKARIAELENPGIVSKLEFDERWDAALDSAN
jgi:hypothetical protein